MAAVLIALPILRRHLHLHVMSSDLVAPALKNKKHYNSFSPDLGFWLPLATVRSWVEADDRDVRVGSALQFRADPLLTGFVFVGLTLRRWPSRRPSTSRFSRDRSFHT